MVIYMVLGQTSSGAGLARLLELKLGALAHHGHFSQASGRTGASQSQLDSCTTIRRDVSDQPPRMR